MDVDGEDTQEVSDPIESVAHSVPGSEDLGGPQVHEELRFGDPSHHAVLDQSIGLTLTQAGLRQLLGRPKFVRPKPLLQLRCLGCDRTTHDEDELLPNEWNEHLVKPIQTEIQ